jgi:hypothetical protein
VTEELEKTAYKNTCIREVQIRLAPSNRGPSPPTTTCSSEDQENQFHFRLSKLNAKKAKWKTPTVK